MTNPIKWHGGKQYLADWILSFVPEHTHYVEPFFGGGAVLLAKEDYEGTSEVVNDLNGNLACFWSALRDPDLFEKLERLVTMTPFSEETFKSCQIMLEEPYRIGPLQRAWAFFVVARQSRQGLMKDFGTLSRNRTRRGMNEQAASWLSAIEGMADTHDRLKRVVILNRPAIEVIRAQDGPGTFFYLDPPYMHETRVTTKDYQHEMSAEDHVELLVALTEIEGKFCLSGYPSKLYDGMACDWGWHRVSREIDNKASSKSTKDTKTECLWMNFTPVRKEAP